ncbi:hypothetical protein L198_02914 [Cryptococcus wingfieldii CBS 7118]|uniref:Uncharacterized protein n=1 Tax=Cryptococcus wingfieldii CBS 7118 TaxID=1295528 RepID=A0A1E3JI82_9TREE|nr:hypothetical protein L198_02914 [Cryptococcus wingfieldii CBS 7118]ODO00594.1 hypothetical protein L198_02914 [Cryptococcus wingfieldii CBS 7118]
MTPTHTVNIAHAERVIMYDNNKKTREIRGAKDIRLESGYTTAQKDKKAKDASKTAAVAAAVALANKATKHKTVTHTAPTKAPSSSKAKTATVTPAPKTKKAESNKAEHKGQRRRLGVYFEETM